MNAYNLMAESGAGLRWGYWFLF